MKHAFIGLSAGLVALLGATASSHAAAFGSMDIMSQSRDHVENVRLVCNEFGRCWRTGPRRWGYYGGPRHYGYYGGPRGYGSPYGYYGRPYREPGISFRFGL